MKSWAHEQLIGTEITVIKWLDRHKSFQEATDHQMIFLATADDYKSSALISARVNQVACSSDAKMECAVF